MDLCKYSNIFGIPGKNIHSIRLFDFAIVDIIITYIVGYIISKYFDINIYITCGILLLFSIIIHKIFCVDTKLISILGL